MTEYNIIHTIKNIMGGVHSVGPTLALLMALAPNLALGQEDSGVTFGTTVVLSTGLRGDIYFLPQQTQHLPKLEKMKPIGSIYTTELNVGIRDFDAGFPGVTDRFEWFAIDYNGKFWIETPGKYTFAIMSDDGSKLYIDGHTTIDNDGVHPARAYGAQVKLKHGEHQIRVSYFQGPRTKLALILAYAAPGSDDFYVFNTEDFLPPELTAELRVKKPDQPLPETPEWKHKRQTAEPMSMAPTIR